MDLTKIPQGPWRELFKGSFQEYPVECYINPDQTILVMILEREGEATTGAIIELYHSYLAKGEVESFTENIKKDILIITRRREGKTFKYLLLGSKPEYSKYDQESIEEEVNNLAKRLDSYTKTLETISTAYNAELVNLNKAGQEERESFLSQPLMAPIISTKGRAREAAPKIELKEEKKAAEKAPEEIKPEVIEKERTIILGLTKEGAHVEEPIDAYTSTLINGGDPDDRRKIVHVMIEEGIISNMAVLVFEETNEYDGIKERSRNDEELKAHKITADPTGFPGSDYYIGKELKADLNHLEPEGLMGLVGAGEGEESKAITSIIRESQGKITSFQNLTQIIQSKLTQYKLSGFQFNKISRMLQIIEMSYPEMFGQNNIEDLMKTWIKGLGRAALIHLTKDDSLNQMAVHSIIRALKKRKESHAGKELEEMIVLPKAVNLVPSKNRNSFTKALVNDLIELTSKGTAYVTSSREVLELDQELAKKSVGRINVIKGEDIGVKVEGRRPYRVILRPPFSKIYENDY